MAIGGAADDNTNAGVSEHLVVLNVQRRSKALANAFGHRDRIAHLLNLSQQNGKLITAKASDHIGGAHAILHNGGHPLQQLIPHPVAKGVVDQLEAIAV